MGEEKKKNFFSSGVPLKTTERLGKAVTSLAAMMLHCLHNASQEVHTHTDTGKAQAEKCHRLEAPVGDWLCLCYIFGQPTTLVLQTASA